MYLNTKCTFKPAPFSAISAFEDKILQISATFHKTTRSGPASTSPLHQFPKLTEQQHVLLKQRRVGPSSHVEGASLLCRGLGFIILLYMKENSDSWIRIEFAATVTKEFSSSQAFFVEKAVAGYDRMS